MYNINMIGINEINSISGISSNFVNIVSLLFILAILTPFFIKNKEVKSMKKADYSKAYWKVFGFIIILYISIIIISVVLNNIYAREYYDLLQ